MFHVEVPGLNFGRVLSSGLGGCNLQAQSCTFPGILSSHAAPVLQHETCCPCTCQASAVADAPTVQLDRCSISLIAYHPSKATFCACPCQLPLCTWHYEEITGNCTWDQALRGGLSCPRCPSAGHCLLWLPPWLLPWPQQGLDALRLSFHHLPAQMPAQYTLPLCPSCQGRTHGMAQWQTFPATKIDAMQGIRAETTRAQSALTYGLNEEAEDSQCFMRLMRVSFQDEHAHLDAF